MRAVSLVYSVYLCVLLVRSVAGFFAVLVVVVLLRAWVGLGLVVGDFVWVSAMVVGRLLRSCVGAVPGVQLALAVRCGGLGWGWLCRVSRRRLPMVLVVMVGLRGVEVAWHVFRFLIALGPGIPFYWLGLWSLFVQGPDSLGMACL